VTESRTLPLFPLSTVLFPGVVLPIHVFEERYKTMIRRCLASDAVLGIVLIREGWEVGPTAVPFEVGTMARIFRSDTLAEGKLNIAVVGQQRFRIRQLIEVEPYLQADVDLVAEDEAVVPDELMHAVRQQFVEYIQTLRRLSPRVKGSIRVPETPPELSYAVAANLQVARTEQQGLLEQPLVPRLQRENDILRRELSLLPKLGAVSSRRVRPPGEVPLN
jgi:Lon protease-like protein